MLARLRAIIAGSRKALLIYTMWLLIVVGQVVSVGGSLLRCANNPQCSWLDFIAIIQKGIENCSMITVACGTLLPALMAFEDAFAKMGLPPAAARDTSLSVTTTTKPADQPAAPAAVVTATATVSSTALSGPPEPATLEPTKERVTTMSIVQKQIPISQPVFDLMKVLEELAADLVEKKPAAEIQQDFIALLGKFTSLGEIPKDFAADPEAVQNSLYLAGDDFAKRILEILKKGKSATAGE